MIGEDCPRNYAYPAHNHDLCAVGRVALDPAQGVALAQPARSSGRRPVDTMPRCRKAVSVWRAFGPTIRKRLEVACRRHQRSRDSPPGSGA